MLGGFVVLHAHSTFEVFWLWCSPYQDAKWIDNARGLK
jgi:hypothetical protein